MPTVSTSVVVSRPPAEVFDFLADARNLVLWSSGVADVDDDAVSPGENAEYRYHYPGRHREHRLVCATYRPCDRIAFRGRRMWSPLGLHVPEYAFHLLPYTRGTLIRLSVTSSLYGGMALFAPVMAMAWRRDLPEDARRLCETLGGGPLPAGPGPGTAPASPAAEVLDLVTARPATVFRTGVGA